MTGNDPTNWLLDPTAGPIVPDASWLDPTRLAKIDWWNLISHLDVATVLPIVLLLAFMIFCRVMASRLKNKQRSRGKKDEDDQFKGALKMGLPLPLKIWWRIRPIPRRYRMQIGPYRIDTRRKHMGIVGATGSRKTTAVSDLVNGDRPTLIATGEPADPLRHKIFALMREGKAVYWSPLHNVGWDMLQGDPMEVAERLTKGHKASAGDTGFRRGIVQDEIMAALMRADDADERRTWPLILKALDQLAANANDRETTAAAKAWSQRFNHMRLALDKALGEDLDIAEELASGKTIFMEMSSMRSPESTPLVAANILLDCKRAAQTVRGGRLIIDEGWAFKERQDEIAQLVRAGRRLGWEIFFLTQLPQDYSDDMLANFRNWLFLMQTGTNVSAREWCSKAVERMLPPKAFSEGTLREGEGWLLTGGRLVRVYVDWMRTGGEVPDVPPEDVIAAAVQSQNGHVPAPGTGTVSPGAVYEVREVEPGRRSGTDVGNAGAAPWESEALALPGYRVNGAIPLAGGSVVPRSIQGHGDRERIWGKFKGTWNPQGCHTWTEKSLNRGYGKARYLGRDGCSTHFLAWWWHLEEDDSDLQRWLAENPDAPRPITPEGDELTRMQALQEWMRKLDLTIDHCCPGSPNKLCNNWRHLKLVSRSVNSKLRWARKNGTYRDVAEDVLSGV